MCDRMCECATDTEHVRARHSSLRDPRTTVEAAARENESARARAPGFGARPQCASTPAGVPAPSRHWPGRAPFHGTRGRFPSAGGRGRPPSLPRRRQTPAREQRPTAVHGWTWLGFSLARCAVLVARTLAEWHSLLLRVARTHTRAAAAGARAHRTTLPPRMQPLSTATAGSRPARDVAEQNVQQAPQAVHVGAGAANGAVLVPPPANNDGAGGEPQDGGPAAPRTTEKRGRGRPPGTGYKQRAAAAAAAGAWARRAADVPPDGADVIAQPPAAGRSRARGTAAPGRGARPRAVRAAGYDNLEHPNAPAALEAPVQQLDPNEPVGDGVLPMRQHSLNDPLLPDWAAHPQNYRRCFQFTVSVERRDMNVTEFRARLALLRNSPRRARTPSRRRDTVRPNFWPRSTLREIRTEFCDQTARRQRQNSRPTCVRRFAVRRTQGGENLRGHRARTASGQPTHASCHPDDWLHQHQRVRQSDSSAIRMANRLCNARSALPIHIGARHTTQGVQVSLVTRAQSSPSCVCDNRA